ncbi:MAG: HD domain-containing protein [Acidobacteria bacterium]|nr:MAG: HD domain-containing protein [Acidobacteriota bacterium]
MPEPVKTEFIADLKPDTTVTSVFLVLAKEVKRKKDDEPYLDLTLGDRTGQVKAVMWDGVAALQSSFERDDFIKIRAQVNVYRDKLQLKLERLRKLEEAEVNLADFLPTTKADVAAMWIELEQRIARIGNPHLRALLEAIFGDPDIAARFRRAPAAKALHHAFLGGLLEHVTSLCRLAEAVMRNYPWVNADLVITGVLLHDLGKIDELNYERSFSYSTPGQLLGHMILVLRILHDRLRALPDFPPSLAALVEHLIISHHGKYEFGSPKLPMFPEALLLHQLDDMDSKMQAMKSQLEDEPNPSGGEWTGYNRSLDRTLLRLSEYWNPDERSAGLGPRGPQPGASISGTRGEAALGPAPKNDATKSATHG